MSEKFGLAQLESPAAQFLDDGRIIMNCSDATAAQVDQEVIKILKQSYDQAKRILSEHRKAMDEIAAFLIEKETITGKEFMEILHRIEGDQVSAAHQEGRIVERPYEAETKAAQPETQSKAEQPEAQSKAAQPEARARFSSLSMKSSLRKMPKLSDWQRPALHLLSEAESFTFYWKRT